MCYDEKEALKMTCPAGSYMCKQPKTAFKPCDCDRKQFMKMTGIYSSLTSIAGLVHVNDLNLTTNILVFPCQTCSVYAMKQFEHKPKIFRNLWIFL